jgi:hypothetical protein
MTPGQSVIFALGLAFLVFILAGDFGFTKVANVRKKITNG